MMKDGEHLCDCCGIRPMVSVNSSAVGAVSFAWCTECLTHPLCPEPESMLAFLYYDVGDHGKGLVPDDQLPGTFKDGRYWSWREWADWASTQPDPPQPDWDAIEASNDSAVGG